MCAGSGDGEEEYLFGMDLPGHFSSLHFLKSVKRGGAGPPDSRVIGESLDLAQGFAKSAGECTLEQVRESLWEIGRIVRGIRAIGMDGRLSIVDSLAWGAGRHINAHPESKEEVLGMAANVMLGICNLQGEHELRQFAEYCRNTLAFGMDEKMPAIIKMACGVEMAKAGQLRGELLFSAVFACGSVCRDTRVAARELVGKLGKNDTATVRIISLGGSGWDAAGKFLGQENDGKRIGQVFAFAYACAIRGSKWGEGVVLRIILEKGREPIGREEFLKIHGRAMRTISARAAMKHGMGQKEKNFDVGAARLEAGMETLAALHRHENLMERMKVRGWWKEALPGEGVPGVGASEGEWGQGVNASGGTEQGLRSPERSALDSISRQIMRSGEVFSLRKMEGFFAFVGETVAGMEGMEAYARINLADALLYTARRHVDGNPESMEEVGGILLPALGKICSFENPGESADIFRNYCEKRMGFGNRAATYYLMKLLSNLGEFGAETYKSSLSLPVSVESHVMSWDAEIRKAARELLGNVLGKDVPRGMLFLASEDASEAVAGFLGREKNADEIRIAFGQAYICALRGSNWGMEVAMKMIAQMDREIISRKQLLNSMRLALMNWQYGEGGREGREAAAERLLEKIEGSAPVSRRELEELKLEAGDFCSGGQRRRDDALRRAKYLDLQMHKYCWKAAEPAKMREQDGEILGKAGELLGRVRKEVLEGKYIPKMKMRIPLFRGK